MPPLSDRINSVLNEVLCRLRAEIGLGLSAVVLSGSYAQGKANHDSDLDLRILWDYRSSQRRILRIDGIDFDIFLDHVSTINAALRAANSRFVISMFASGVTLYDRDGFGDRLIAAASHVYASHPKPLAGHALYRHRALVHDGLRALATSEEPETSLIAGNLLPAWIELYWATNRLWGVPMKRALPEIQRLDRDTFELVRVLLDQQCIPAQRRSAARRIARLVGIDGEQKEFSLESPRTDTRG